MCDEGNMESLGIEDYPDSREFAWVMEVPSFQPRASQKEILQSRLYCSCMQERNDRFPFYYHMYVTTGCKMQSIYSILLRRCPTITLIFLKLGMFRFAL